MQRVSALHRDVTDNNFRLGGSREKIAEDAARAHEAFQRAKDEVTNAEELVQVPVLPPGFHTRWC